MADAPVFRLAADQDGARHAAEALFETVRRDLMHALSASADIDHVGATAVPGCLTKGDLDVVVRVVGADFTRSEMALAARFARNTGSVRTDAFAAFEDSGRSPHLGIQLTAKGGALDVFHLFVQALRDDPALVHRYNALKLRHDGEAESEYRVAKNAFVSEVLHSMRT